MKIRHHIAARLDVLEIVEHYEKDAPDPIAAEFFEELLACLEQIRVRPKSFGVVTGNLRQVYLRRFPYNIIFETVDSDTIQILTVRHNGRHPSFGLDRY